MTQKPVYRQSEIKDFLMCGKKWQFKYLDKLEFPKRAAAAIGSAVDTGVSLNLAQKVETGRDLPIDQVVASCSDDFDKRAQATVFDEDEGKDPSKDAAISVARFHHLNVAPLLRPKTVQEKFVIETDAGFDLSGTIDYTDVDGMVGDTKTASRQRASSYVVERSFQPALYTYADEALRQRPSKGFRFDIVTRPTKTLGPEYKPVSGVVTVADHAWLFDSIGQVHKAITAGVALPAAEGSWHCSQKWCEFWSICKGKK